MKLRNPLILMLMGSSSIGVDQTESVIDFPQLKIRKRRLQTSCQTIVHPETIEVEYGAPSLSYNSAPVNSSLFFTNCNSASTCHFRVACGGGDGKATLPMPNSVTLVSIAPSGTKIPYTISAETNDSGGYTQEISLRCATGRGDGACTSFKIIQKPQPVTFNCNTKTGVKAFTDPNQAYAASPATTSVTTTGWTDFFTNTDTGQCPVMSCTLKAKGCSSAYSGAGVGNLSFFYSSWQLRMNQDVPAGYTEEAGFECEFGGGSVTNSIRCSDFTITQMKLDCRSGTIVQNVNFDPNEAYSIAPAIVVPGSNTWESFFATSDANCPMLSCTLYASGCNASPYVPGRLKLLSPISGLQMQTDIQIGYTEQASLECDFGGGSVTNCVMCNDFTVTQQHSGIFNCASVFSTLTFIIPDSACASGQGSALLTSFFSNSESTNCPVIDTKLVTDCLGTETPITGSRISLDNVSSVKWDQFEPDGWSETVSIIQRVGGPAVINSQKCTTFTINQQPAVCSGKLTAKTSVTTNSKTLNYNNDLTGQARTTVTNALDFFTNFDPTCCPVSACTLYDQATSSLVSSTSKIILDPASTPWYLSANQMIPQGYNNFKVYSKCQNSAGEQQSIDFTVNQGLIDCTPALNNLSGPSTTEPDFSYDSILANKHMLGTWDKFFTNTDQENCDITSCSIHEDDCTQPVSTSCSQSVDQFSQIECDKSVKEGYTKDICIKCHNDQYGQTYKTVEHTITITQKSVCYTSLVATASLITSPTPQNQDPVNPVKAIISDSTIFYNELESTICKDRCQLLYDDCFTPWSDPLTETNKVWMDSNGPFAISMNMNFDGGYDHNLCVQCFNTDPLSVNKASSLTQQNLNFKLIYKCTVPVMNPVSFDKTYIYDMVLSSYVVGTGLSFFTGVPGAGGCQISSCELRQKGCNTPYPVGELTMDTNTPWNIIFDRSINTEISKQVCIRCHETDFNYVFDNDNVKVTRKAQCVPLSTTLTALAGPFSYSYEYDKDVPSFSFAAGQDYFVNNEVNCIIKSCSLMENPGCSTPLPEAPSKLSIGIQSPFNLRVNKSIPQGIDLTICVSCKIGGFNYIMQGVKVKVNPLVCSLTVTSSNPLSYLLYRSGPAQKDDLTPWFSASSISNPAQPSFCQVSYALYGDVALLNSLQLSQVTISGSELTITTESTLPRTTFYLKATAPDGTSSYKEIKVKICGSEQITSQSPIEANQFKDTGTISKKIKFDSNDPECPVNNLTLVDQAGNAYTLQDIRLNSINDVLISTEKVTTKSVFLKATSLSGQTGIVELKVNVSSSILRLDNLCPSFNYAPEDVIVEYEPKGDISQTIKLQKVKEQPGLKVEMLVTGLQPFMSYDESKSTVDLNNIAENKGVYYIKIKLSDQCENFEKYQIKVTIREKYEFKLIENLKKLQESKLNSTYQMPSETNKTEKVVKRRRLSAEITKINAIGQVDVQFNETMRILFPKNLNKTDFNYTALNKSNIDIVIIRYPEGTNNTDFTWKVLTYEDDLMVLKLNFNNPEQISLHSKQDTIRIDMRRAVNQSLILAFHPQVDFEVPDQIIRSRLRKQMEDTELTRDFVSGTQKLNLILKITLIICFILAQSFQGTLNYLLAFLQSLQLILHLAMIKIILPANVSSFFELVIEVINFDLLDPSYTTELIFKFNKEANQVQEKYQFDQVKDLGYETNNMWLNLGSISLYLTFYMFWLLFWLAVTTPLAFYTTNFDTWKRWRKQLFFYNLIAVVSEGYLTILISCHMTIYQPLFNEDGEVTSVVLGYFNGFVCYLLFPAIILYVLFQKIETIRSEEFKLSFGSLYEFIQLDQKKFKLFYLVSFFGRRLIFTLVLFELQNHPAQQVQILLLMNLFVIEYYGSAMPMIGRTKNRQDLFNEVNINTCTLFFMIFSNWADGPETVHFYGWWLVAFMSSNIFVNLSFIFWNMSKNCWLLAVKYYRILRFKFENRKSNLEYNNRRINSETVPQGEIQLAVVEEPVRSGRKRRRIKRKAEEEEKKEDFDIREHTVEEEEKKEAVDAPHIKIMKKFRYEETSFYGQQKTKKRQEKHPIVKIEKMWDQPSLETDQYVLSFNLNDREKALRESCPMKMVSDPSKIVVPQSLVPAVHMKPRELTQKEKDENELRWVRSSQLQQPYVPEPPAIPLEQQLRMLKPTENDTKELAMARLEQKLEIFDQINAQKYTPRFGDFPQTNLPFHQAQSAFSNNASSSFSRLTLAQTNDIDKHREKQRKELQKWVKKPLAELLQ